MIMKAVALLMCLLGSSLAAPAPDSSSNEQVASHANTAVQLMELYRLLAQMRQQGFGAAPNDALLPAAPVAPAAPAPVDTQPQVSPQAPQQGFFFNPALFAPQGDGSDEEEAPQFRGFYHPYGYQPGQPAQPAQPAAPLNSDEAEGAEEAEAAEGAEAAEAGAEPEPAGTALPVDAAVGNEIPPIDVPVEPAPQVIATAAVDPAIIPEAPAVGVEIDTTLVGTDVAAGAGQVLVAEAPDAAQPMQ